MDADIKWLDEPETFRVNQLPAHSDHYYYGNYDEWRHNNSRFAQNLDGQWQFNFAENLKDIASGEKPPKLEGKSMSLVLAKNIK